MKNNYLLYPCEIIKRSPALAVPEMTACYQVVCVCLCATPLQCAVCQATTCNHTEVEHISTNNILYIYDSIICCIMGRNVDKTTSISVTKDTLACV